MGKPSPAATPTYYTVDLNAGLTQVLTDGSSTSLYGLGRVGEQQPSGFVYHLPDALGSVRQLADADADVTLTRSCEPFGTTLAESGAGETVRQFTGEARDTDGLTFLRARYLSTYQILVVIWSGLYRSTSAR